MRLRLIMLPVLMSALFSAFAQSTTVTVWMHDHPPRIALDERLIAEFEQANPGISVVYEVIPTAEFDSRLLTALSAGGGPDLFNQFTGAVGDFHALGALAPYSGSLEELRAEYQSGLDGATFDGTVYGLPTEVSNYACYVNDDHWREAGLDPEADYPATWEELVEVASRLTVRDASGALVRRGYDFNWTAPIFMVLTFNPMVRQLGGALIDESTVTSQLATPEVERVMQYWHDWVNIHQLGGPQYTGSRDAFLAGELSMECSMAYPFVPQLREAGIDFSIHPVPRWSDATVDAGFDVYGYFMMVNARSRPDVQEAAWDLARHLTSYPADYFEIAGLLQPKGQFIDSPTITDNELMQVFLDELEVSEFMLRFPGFNEASDAMARARDRVVIGREPIEAVLADTDREVSAILERAQRDAGRR
jgi:multiple sugar transport system substrate-binding protein